MDSRLNDFLDYTFVSADGFTIDVRWLMTFILYLAIALGVLMLIRKLLKQASVKKWWIGKSREKAIYNSVKIPLLLILIEESLSLFGPGNGFTQIINYPLLDFDSVKLTLRNILVFISVILLMRFFIALIEFAIHRSIKKKPWINKATEYSFVKLTSYTLYLIAIFIGIKSIGIDISLLLGASAAILVGIGFGLQDIFKDFVSGVLILFEGNFKVGDVIEYKNTVARVTRIDLRTSRLLTRDGNRILIPNSILVGNEIINWSISNPDIRFLVEVGVAYGSDTQLVSRLLTECANHHESVIRKEETVVIFSDFSDSSLQFKLFFWCNKSWDENPIKSDIRFAIDQAFRDNKVKIPFPQRDIHVVQLPEEKTKK